MKPETVALEEETDGYLKLKFDHKDGLLPRSVISFYHSQTEGSGFKSVQIIQVV